MVYNIYYVHERGRALTVFCTPRSERARIHAEAACHWLDPAQEHVAVVVVVWTERASLLITWNWYTTALCYITLPYSWLHV